MTLKSAAQVCLCALLPTLLFTVSCRLFAGSGCDGAGNCYVYAAADGAGDGSSWTNAYTGFGNASHQVNPGSMTRGVTYWIASGSYGGVTFNTPDSGTSIITIEGATTSSHGPASDWSNSFAGQAVFGSSFVSTDYWTFNGQARGSDWQSGYTIKFWNQSNPSGAAMTVGGNSAMNFQYIEMEGTGAGFPNNTGTSDRCNTNNCGSWADNGIYENSPISNLYVGYSFVHNTGNTQFQMNVTSNGGSVSNNTTWEYNWVSYNHTGQNGQHDEAYSLYASNVAIRYNVFQDICGSGLITTAGAAQPNVQNWAVYGNLFFWDATYAVFNGEYSLATIDNAVLDFLGEKMSGYVYFYNNTMAGFNNSVVTGQGTAFSTLAISGVSGSGGSACGSSCPSVQIYNNLWYDSAEVTGDYSAYCQVVTGAACTQDYDAVYNGTVPSGYLNAPSETHGYVVTASTIPFLNWTASTIAGFQLITPDPFSSHAGTSLSSPYNFDGFNQVTRGVSGVWDRGAEQLGSGSQPNPPTNLAAIAQ